MERKVSLPLHNSPSNTGTSLHDFMDGKLFPEYTDPSAGMNH